MARAPARLALLLSAVALLGHAPWPAASAQESEPEDAERDGEEDAKPPPVRAGTDSEQRLRAPPERDGFSFVILGDRTTGPRSGLRVLERAVTTTNRLDPDLVMTVGDMINGYNRAPEWREQMRAYKEIVSELDAPWYPVVGNHDVYARPRREDGHTDLYREHFGPLYYSFDYRWAHFVCLFSDESLSFSNPARDQNMSEEQLDWLREDLEATDARQVFVFLHHPRWTYEGTNWDAVHRVLAEDGRAEAVFAGHIHTYRDDGARDGIHYYTLAVTGGRRAGRARESASFHHVNHVRVRPDGITMGVLRVGSVLPSDVIRGEEIDELRRLYRGDWIDVEGRLEVTPAGRGSEATLRLTNPLSQPLDYALEVSAPDGWSLSPRSAAGRLPPESARELPLSAVSAPLGGRRPDVRLTVRTTYAFASGQEQPVELERRLPVRAVGVAEAARPRPEANRVLVLDGSSALRHPGLAGSLDGLGAFTLECWVRGEEPAGRQVLLAKTQGSAFGLFWSSRGSRPKGYVHLRGHGYLTVEAPSWDWGAWTHVALVYTGEVLRLYVGGELAREAEQPGRITPNDLPFYVGADPDGRGRPTSHFEGAVDDVRLSRVARYREAFEPPAVHAADEDTLLLLHFDHEELGGLHPDASGRGHHGWAVGTPRTEGEDRPGVGGDGSD